MGFFDSIKKKLTLKDNNDTCILVTGTENKPPSLLNESSSKKEDSFDIKETNDFPLVSTELIHLVEKVFDDVLKDVYRITDLTPQELSVMYYVNNHQLGKSRDYWLINAGVDVIEAATHYIDFGYATYAPLDPWDKTVSELKEMLRSKGAKVSGTKDDLVDRISDYYSEEELISLNPEKRIKLTQKGHFAMNATPYTLLRNHIVERDCLLLIINGDYYAAHKKISDYVSPRQLPVYPVNVDTFNCIQQMKVFNDDVFDTIYNAMQLLALLTTGKNHTPMVYTESWIPGYRGTDKAINTRMVSEYDRVMKRFN